MFTEAEWRTVHSEVKDLSNISAVNGLCKESCIKKQIIEEYLSPDNKLNLFNIISSLQNTGMPDWNLGCIGYLVNHEISNLWKWILHHNVVFAN